jgi:putative hydrolase of HD superfamily
MNARLIYKFFEAANMQRWNDHIRPVELTELDKQSHKMVIAYVLARFEETEKGVKIDWTKIIEGGIFEFLHRIFLTDLKPPVYHRMQKREGQRAERVRFPRARFGGSRHRPEFLERFKAYHLIRTRAWSAASSGRRIIWPPTGSSSWSTMPTPPCWGSRTPRRASRCR